MGIKKFKPITPGRRFMTISDFEEITTDRPHKPLLERLKSKAGRNNSGRVTVRFRGGGHKRHYRLIDFKRDKDNIPAKVETIEYDPNRTARIALVCYADGERRYILAPIGLKVGDTVMSGEEADIKPGNCLPLIKIPAGTMVHNIEMKPGKGAQLARSAGTYAQLVGKEGKYAQLRMPSSEVRMVLLNCRASVGQVTNELHSNLVTGKAGKSRWAGRRPHVRGAAMNPVDHPHGGGEGKGHAGNPHPVTPWGKPTKGYKTRGRKKTSDKMIMRRRSVGKRG